MPGDLLCRPLIEIAQALREKGVTAQELVAAATARHERFGDRLSAYSLWAPEQARAVAKQPEGLYGAFNGETRPG
jgi:Asp-tRNA(Asn)/Glu-tRNA(Gln) amidotransferase A subunit family amidase